MYCLGSIFINIPLNLLNKFILIKDGISHSLLPIRCSLILMLRGFNSSLKFIIFILVFKYTKSSRRTFFPTCFSFINYTCIHRRTWKLNFIFICEFIYLVLNSIDNQTINQA